MRQSKQEVSLNFWLLNDETNFLLFTERPPQVFCYLTSWSAKRPGAGKFEPKDVDAKLCTHVVYAFATLKDHKLSEANDTDPEMYDEVLALREVNPELQVLLAIGGWAFGSTPFKELTSNVFRMNQFVYEAIDFLREYQFNGLDIDWGEFLIILVCNS